MKFAKALYDRYSFVLSSIDVIKNLAVYRTSKGPIFAVFGSSNELKIFLDGNDQIMAGLKCSPDMRKPLNDEQRKRMLDLLKEYFGYKNPIELITRVIKASKKLEKMDGDLLAEEKLINSRAL